MDSKYSNYTGLILLIVCLLPLNVLSQFDDLVEVTEKPPESLGAIEKCGEGKDAGVHLCVPYHMCDAKTKTIVPTGVTDGFGIIDIRFGESPCNQPLEVCCGIPDGGIDPKFPLPGPDSSTVPTTSYKPPIVTTPTPPGRSFCGIRQPNGIDFKITGNTDNEAEYGEFPWMVAVMKKNVYDSEEQKLICGGSLITPNVVLTGAHCVYKHNVNDIMVRAGEWDTQTTRERLPYQERDVSRSIIHNEFNNGNLFNDFALLILSRPFDQAAHIGTICLPTFGQTVNSGECFVSGWGKDAFGKKGRYQSILKKIQLPTVERSQCQNALRNTRLGKNFVLDKSFICAGGEVGKDACTGDGGSPLVCPDPFNSKRYVQVGIVAWGIGCGSQNVPGVYADVAGFRTWIDRQMERLNLDTAPYNL